MIQSKRKKLPTFPYRKDILLDIKYHKVLILVGETGYVKTKKIPQYLMEVFYGRMVNSNHLVKSKEEGFILN